jgi:mutator protein MutT
VGAHPPRARADLTLAAHEHLIRIPYGELVIAAGRVAAYREKPVHATWVCSATCVLGPAALAAVDGPTGLPELTERVIERGGEVRAFEHAAPWIDVNDAGDLARAAALLAAQPGLETWASSPDVSVVGAIIRDGARLLLERRRGGADAGLWDTPGGKVEPGEAPAAALVRELREELGVDVGDPGSAIACFDALESDGRIARHHVFALRAAAAGVRACEGQTLEWFDLAALPDDRARVVSRSLAWIDGEAAR